MWEISLAGLSISTIAYFLHMEKIEESLLIYTPLWKRKRFSKLELHCKSPNNSRGNDNFQ